MEWSFRVFWNFLEHVIMEKGRSEKYFSELAVGCCDVWIGYVGGFLWLGLSLCVKGLR